MQPQKQRLNSFMYILFLFRACKLSFDIKSWKIMALKAPCQVLPCLRYLVRIYILKEFGTWREAITLQYLYVKIEKLTKI